MRGKRSKQYRKLMQQYGLTFNFREPYQVLLSSQIIQDSARCKMRLGALLESTLHGSIKPMITQCCIRHLYNTTNHTSQSEKDEWITVAKSAERRRCGHHELSEPLSELDCLKSVVDPKDSGTNKHRYVIATQDAEVRRYMRTKIAGVPLIYIARSVMILEPMGGKTEEVKEAEERSKYRAGIKSRRGESGVAVGEKRKRDEVGEEEGGKETPKKRKIKGPKGPNPLSVKKAKKSVEKKLENGQGAAKREASGKKITADGEAASTTAAIVGGIAEGEAAKKRKRKRKPKHADATAAGDASATSPPDGEGDGDAGDDD